jgi:hypothetical protein
MCARESRAGSGRGSGSPANDRLLLVLLSLAVAGRGADPRARDAASAAEAVQPHAPRFRHGAAVRRPVTLASRGRCGDTFRSRRHGLRRVRRPFRRPHDERRPPVGAPEPRAPGAEDGAPRRRAAQALGHHPLAHVLRQPQREPLEVAVEPVGERVGPRERATRPRPHRLPIRSSSTASLLSSSSASPSRPTSMATWSCCCCCGSPATSLLVLVSSAATSCGSRLHRQTGQVT